MKKTLTIGGHEVEFNSNAYTPIKYRTMFNEDLLASLQKISDKNMDIDVLSKLAYCMAITDMNMEDWLSQFEMVEFYEALPSILELWVSNTKSISTPKKAVGK